MSRRRIVLFIVFFALVWPMAIGARQQQPPQPQGKTLSLSLDDCVVRALRNNLAIQVAEISPQSADLSVSRAQEKYYPTMSFNYSQRSNNSASYSWLESAEKTVTDSNNYSAQISQLIPLGGRFTASLSGSMTDTNQRATTINPRYSGELRFNFSQPLLRDFGIKMTQRDIIVARNNFDISETQFYKTVQDTIYTITNAYWQLVYSIENLKVQRLALQLAQEFLAKNKLSVEIGTLSPMDVLSAESEVAAREASILAAEASVKNNEDTLKTLINLSEEEERGLRDVVALDKPTLEEQKVALDQALMIAMEKRPDLKINRIDLKNLELNLSYARNQLLPNLSFTASYWSPGVAGTRLIYDNPLFGNIIGTVPGSSRDAMKDAFNFKYKNWSVGLTLDIPLNNILSGANYAQTKLAMEQALLSLENQEKQVVLEIRNAVRSLETSYKQVAAYKLSRELAEKKLQAEEEKLRVGLSTNYFVLQYQRDLTTQRTAELQAVINYNMAIVRLDQATGVLLEKKNIKVSDLLIR